MSNQKRLTSYHATTLSSMRFFTCVTPNIIEKAMVEYFQEVKDKFEYDTDDDCFKIKFLQRNLVEEDHSQLDDESKWQMIMSISQVDEKQGSGKYCVEFKRLNY